MAIKEIEVLHDICLSVFCCIGSALVRNKFCPLRFRVLHNYILGA